jgi:hypothetical protein
LNPASASAGSTPEAEVPPAVANFRQEFSKESRLEVLMEIGGKPRQCQQMMESLLEDLQPPRGLESHLVEQMGETFWRYLTSAILATQCVVRSDGIQSEVNLAALMAPEDPKSLHLQRLEDANLHRLWRLINVLGKVRQGPLEKKNVK